MTTSPTIVALGAIKQLFPNAGEIPLTGSITGMAGFFYEYGQISNQMQDMTGISKNERIPQP
jgi:hypothetical protein